MCGFVGSSSCLISWLHVAVRNPNDGPQAKKCQTKSVIAARQRCRKSMQDRSIAIALKTVHQLGGRFSMQSRSWWPSPSAVEVGKGVLCTAKKKHTPLVGVVYIDHDVTCRVASASRSHVLLAMEGNLPFTCSTPASVAVSCDLLRMCYAAGVCHAPATWAKPGHAHLRCLPSTKFWLHPRQKWTSISKAERLHVHWRVFVA